MTTFSQDVLAWASTQDEQMLANLRAEYGATRGHVIESPIPTDIALPSEANFASTQSLLNDLDTTGQQTALMGLRDLTTTLDQMDADDSGVVTVLEQSLYFAKNRPSLLGNTPGQFSEAVNVYRRVLPSYLESHQLDTNTINRGWGFLNMLAKDWQFQAIKYKLPLAEVNPQVYGVIPLAPFAESKDKPDFIVRAETDSLTPAERSALLTLANSPHKIETGFSGTETVYWTKEDTSPLRLDEIFLFGILIAEDKTEDRPARLHGVDLDDALYQRILKGDVSPEETQVLRTWIIETGTEKHYLKPTTWNGVPAYVLDTTVKGVFSWENAKLMALTIIFTILIERNVYGRGINPTCRGQTLKAYQQDRILQHTNWARKTMAFLLHRVKNRFLNTAIHLFVFSESHHLINSNLDTFLDGQGMHSDWEDTLVNYGSAILVAGSLLYERLGSPREFNRFIDNNHPECRVNPKPVPEEVPKDVPVVSPDAAREILRRVFENPADYIELTAWGTLTMATGVLTVYGAGVTTGGGAVTGVGTAATGGLTASGVGAPGAVLTGAGTVAAADVTAIAGVLTLCGAAVTAGSAYMFANQFQRMQMNGAI